MDATTQPLGLALSGGGFRAALFHLGVLKRMREVNLLDKVDVISTVSGGSITGAYWVYWQATKGDTLNDDREWDGFEASLISFIRSGVRGRVMWRGLALPLVALSIVVLGSAWWLSAPASWVLGAGIASTVAAYLNWHYESSRLLQKEYDRRLFSDATMEDLDFPGRNATKARHWPRLIVNCTTLNTGHPIAFTHQHPSRGLPPWQSKNRRPRAHEETVSALVRNWAPVPIPTNVAISKAVAASSCFPGAFTPIKLSLDSDLGSRLGGVYHRHAGRAYSIQILDGGVFDNRGMHALEWSGCKKFILSDASAAFRIQNHPSTWQFFPPGRGVVFRVQDIIYSRASDLSHRNWRSKLDRDSYRHMTLSKAGGMGGMTEALCRFLAGIRTDLDRFSDVEISSLMFLGYNNVQMELYNAPRFNHGKYRDLSLEKLSSPPREFRFHSCDARICLDWMGMTTGLDHREMEDKQLGIMRHLEASDSRFALWRRFRRFRNKWRKQVYFLDYTLESQPRALRRAVLEEFRRSQEAHERMREKLRERMNQSKATRSGEPG